MAGTAKLRYALVAAVSAVVVIAAVLIRPDHADDGSNGIRGYQKQR